MSYQFPPDVERLVKDRLVHGGYASEDDVLRDALRALEEISFFFSQPREGLFHKPRVAQRTLGKSTANPMNPSGVLHPFHQ